MDLKTFEEQFKARRWLLIDQVMDVLVEAQEDVYVLIPELVDEDDRRRATELVEQMADVIPPFLERRSRARALAEQTLQKSWREPVAGTRSSRRSRQPGRGSGNSPPKLGTRGSPSAR